jgi:hypothetical protein
MSDHLLLAGVTLGWDGVEGAGVVGVVGAAGFLLVRVEVDPPPAGGSVPVLAYKSHHELGTFWPL